MMWQQVGQYRSLLLLYVVTFVVVLPPVCVWLRLYQSLYYQAYIKLSHALDTDNSLDGELYQALTNTNNARIQQAENVMMQHQQGHLCPREGKIDIAITVITASRDIYWNNKVYYAPRYLIQSVAKFASMMHLQRKYKYCLAVCSVDSKLDNDTLALSKHTYLIHKPREELSGQTETKWDLMLEREKEDYMACLNESLVRLEPEFVLMLEDDTVARADALDTLEYIMTWYSQPDWEVRPWLPRLREVGYVKLYHPKRVEGYLGTEHHLVLGLLGFVLLCGPVSGAVLSQVPGIKGWPVVGRWAVSLLYTALLALCVGRPHMESPRRLSPQLYTLTRDSPCCSQALLYPRQAALLLLTHLASLTCRHGFPKDAAIEAFGRTPDHPGYLIQPSLFEHIGLVSAVHKSVIDPHMFLE